MNPFILYRDAVTHKDLQNCLPQIVWRAGMTLDDFISANELLVQDLITDKTDENAEYVRKLDTQRELLVSFMEDMYEYYIYWDDTYLLCSH